MRSSSRLNLYTAHVIKTLKARRAQRPDFVQIGNEITGGTLWPDAQVKVPLSTVKVFSGDVTVITPPEPYDDAKQWDHLIRILKAAERGRPFRDCAGGSCSHRGSY